MIMKGNIYKAFLLLFACILLQREAVAQVNLDKYNVVWDSLSKNSSESMPCGGGDIGMNVWADSREIFMYVARSGNFDENNALMKNGRITIQFMPNILYSGKFKQELHLKEGYVT